MPTGDTLSLEPRALNLRSCTCCLTRSTRDAGLGDGRFGLHDICQSDHSRWSSACIPYRPMRLCVSLFRNLHCSQMPSNSEHEKSSASTCIAGGCMIQSRLTSSPQPWFRLCPIRANPPSQRCRLLRILPLPHILTDDTIERLLLATLLGLLLLELGVEGVAGVGARHMEAVPVSLGQYRCFRTSCGFVKRRRGFVVGTVP